MVFRVSRHVPEERLIAGNLDFVRPFTDFTV